MQAEELKKSIKKEIKGMMAINEGLLQAESDLLFELNYNIEDIYDYHVSPKSPFLIEFKDNLGRINVIKAKINNGYLEIKFYWLKEHNGLIDPTYETPPNITAKTFNTYLYLFINHFLELHDNFVLQPTDDIRQRLYKIMLNKYLDQTIWDILEYKDKLFIRKKNNI